MGYGTKTQICVCSWQHRFVCVALGRNGCVRILKTHNRFLALLETLKDDPDARVREQVATDMRDIVKEYPEVGYATLERWGQDGKAETQKILKQALKYQVKIGDERAFKLLGLGGGAEVRQGRHYTH